MFGSVVPGWVYRHLELDKPGRTDLAGSIQGNAELFQFMHEMRRAAAAAGANTFVPAGFGLTGNIVGSRANFNALGFALPAGSDGNVTFSSNFTFDFDSSDGVSVGAVDFESVAAHEIGHILGFFSVVDDIDFLMSMSTTDNVNLNPLDLYRFDDAAADNPTSFLTFTTEPRSIVPGNVEHFDQILPIGGGAEVLMSTGISQGDGRQASHWKDNLGLGLMDPTLGFQEVVQISGSDMRALDLIGYEITTIPEARAWLCSTVVICVSCVGSMLRRRWAAAVA